MPRYHFHIRDALQTEDDAGRQLEDIESARAHATELARERVCADVKKGYLNLDHYIEVTDEGGQTLFRLSFRDAFTITG